MTFPNPKFTAKPVTINLEPSFTPWSEQIGQLFPSNSLLDPLSFLSTFRTPHPYLIHQQNNFYSSNFSFNPLQGLLGSHQNHYPAFSYPSINSPAQRILPPSRPSKALEIIEISDDEEPLPIKLEMARIKQKVEPISNKHIQEASLFKLKKAERSILEKMEEIEGEQLRRQSRQKKKISKPSNSLKESSIVSVKNRKPPKERFVYQLTEQEKVLMEFSRYREYRPHEIMVGPQFQANIPNFRSNESRFSWLKTLQKQLQMRRIG